MVKQMYKFSILSGIIIFSTPHLLHGVVASVIGDTGIAQAGTLKLSGGLSGATFDSTTSTVTQSFDFISLPGTTATNGQMLISSEPMLHKFPQGNQNMFVGSFAGNFGVSGAYNTGCGDNALNVLTTGNFNTGMGSGSLIAIADGSSNTALGFQAGNSLIGGSNNIFIGNAAGSAYTTSENNNIVIGGNPGTMGETLTIRIGDGSTQQNCYIDGIYGSPIDFESALSVYVDVNMKLGTVSTTVDIVTHVTSAITNATSNALLNLNPISAVPKTKPQAKKRYALIANQVQKVLPDLVTVDKHGNPTDVKLQDLTVLMLDQLQRQAARIAALETKVACLVSQVTTCKK